MEVSRRQKIVRFLLGVFFLVLLIVALLPTMWGVVHFGVYAPALIALAGLFGCIFWPRVPDGCSAVFGAAGRAGYGCCCSPC